MSRIRWIFSNINVVNIVLVAVVIVLGYSMLLPLFGRSTKLTLPAPKKPVAAPAATAEKPAESKSPSPSDFFLIAEQNVFHPERKIPVDKTDAQPLPKPEFVLYGTLVLDDLHVAYMEDKKDPQNAPTRGKKQIPVRQGEALSGFVLKEVHPDMVVMARGDEKIDVYLNDPSKSKTRESAITTTAQAAPPAPGQQRVPPTPAGALQKSPQQRPAAATAQGAQDQNPQPSGQQPQVRRGLFGRQRNPN